MCEKEKIEAAEIFRDLRGDELEKVAGICDEVAFDDGEDLCGKRSG